MSCSAPINLSNTPSGECELKCEYRYEYGNSNVMLRNKGNYISLNYDQKTEPEVLFNTDRYSIREVRIYTPSLHTYNGKKAPAEMLIIHSSSNKNLIVSIPLITDTSQTDSSKFFNKVSEYIRKFAQNTNNVTSMGGSVEWNLNDWIPKKNYYSYIGTSPFENDRCSGKYNYVVFDMNLGATASINKRDLDEVKKYISINNINTKNNKYFISKNTAKYGLGPTNDDIYISCSPTGSSTDQELVQSGGADGSGSNMGSSSKKNFFERIIDYIKTGSILKNKYIQIIIAIVLIIILYRFIMWIINILKTFNEKRMVKKQQMVNNSSQN